MYNHITTIQQVNDPVLVMELANHLMQEHGIYIQPINYPTVKKGQEMLRIAPTPHHTKDMMNYFVDAVMKTWLNCGLKLRSKVSIECEICSAELRFDAFDNRKSCQGGTDCKGRLLSHGQ